MQINAVNNNQQFKGAIRETKKGNIYEKSNECKKWMPVVTTTTAGIGIIIHSIAERMGHISPQANLLPAKLAPLGNLFRFLAAPLAGLIIGAICDPFVNITRRKDADTLAETGQIKQDTNRGKIFFAASDALLESINLFAIKKTSGSINKFNIIAAVVGTLSSLCLGAVYDLGVNKFRDRLAYNAEVQAEKQAEFNKRIEEQVNQIIMSKTQNS